MTPLEELLETLDRAIPSDDPSFLVAAFGSQGDDGVLVTDSDLTHLLGWQVPPECWAVGLVGTGTRISLAEPSFRGQWPPDSLAAMQPFPDTDPAGTDTDPAGTETGGDNNWDPGRMRLCCLVGRDGAVASLLRTPDGAMVASGDAEGRVIDALRRALGLATPPPQHGTADLLAVLWVDNLLAAADAGTVLGWPQAAALHPAMRVLASEGHDLGVEHLTMIARVATAAWSWDNLRLQSYEDNWLSDLVPAKLAEWMDDGMFSRWLMADLPPVPRADSTLRDVFGPDVWQEVQAVIQATGAGTHSGDEPSPSTTTRDGCQRRAAPEPGRQPPAMPRN